MCVLLPSGETRNYINIRKERSRLWDRSHYLMFGRHPHLPVDYYFLMVSAFECSNCMPAYMMEVRRCFKEAYAEAHLQMNCEAEKQKWYYDRAMSTMQLVPGDVVLMKNDAYQGK